MSNKFLEAVADDGWIPGEVPAWLKAHICLSLLHTGANMPVHVLDVLKFFHKSWAVLVIKCLSYLYRDFYLDIDNGKVWRRDLGLLHEERHVGWAQRYMMLRVMNVENALCSWNYTEIFEDLLDN